MTKAVLDGQLVNNTYQIKVNQIFNVTVMPIDSITRRRLGNITWKNWTWQVNVTLLSLPKFNRPGALSVINNTLVPIINTEMGTVSVHGLKINDTGMYTLSIHLTTPNQEHSIYLTSNAILVINSTGKLKTEMDYVL